MPQLIKAAVVGVGHLGWHHARLYCDIPGVDLVGVADIDEKRGKKSASKFSTSYFKDYRELASVAQAVSVVTPTETHYEVASYFLEKGIHTLVEKPITNIPENAARLIDLADRNNAILQVGHVERFNGAVKKAREYIKEPKFIEVTRLSRFPGRSLDIGVVLDLMIHDIDIILSFVDSSVEKIDAIGASLFSEGKEDIANCRLRFENGCVANITASRISYKSERKFRVFEASRYISLDYEKQEFVVYSKKGSRVKAPGDIERTAPKIRRTEPLREELRDFTRCVREKDAPEVNGRHGLTALKLAIEISDRL